MKVYCKQPFQAEQFDGSSKMVDKYELIDTGIILGTHSSPELYLTGSGKVDIGDWIATGIKGEHWAIEDDVFKKMYAELPVIPKYVSDWIEKCKNGGTSIGDMLCSERRPEKMRDWMSLAPGTYNFDQRRYSKCQELVARAWLDGYQVEEDK
ncbi:hypothetical protein C1940_06750 [Lactiplantibacillus plantarum subsp. plantarum]|uniref:DUF1642 domain-containing protein n=1 Tax=Lactiplantibacillus plantarum TaxID=1590 RepID=UPI000CD36C6E|nr:DUF1642 domain-containing protein [Lactiplantibacillus plantarum]AUV72180.1 hypothetical protein C1940_06750 [Lactiplantibacillus plantarum subsp. plantarum]